ncbi:MAG: hypothetical protein AAFX94_09240 [Myxococcota bacterium]
MLWAVVALIPVEPTLNSQDGVVHLRWDGDTAEAYELEHAFEGEIRLTSVGSAEFYLSGLREGEHRYRLRPAGADAWSDPITVTVLYPNRNIVATLLLVGALMLLTTGWAILRGGRD